MHNTVGNLALLDEDSQGASSEHPWNTPKTVVHLPPDPTCIAVQDARIVVHPAVTLDYIPKVAPTLVAEEKLFR